RLIFAPDARLVPALTLCEITIPVATFFDLALVTLPVRQCATAILRFAVASSLPFTFGTRHFTVGLGAGTVGVGNVGVGADTSLNVALTAFAASIVTVHEPVPEHAPPRPAKLE